MVDLYSEHPEWRQIPLVVTGISGMAIGFPLASKLNLEICVVRKDGDSVNAMRKVEGYIPQGDYLILDDFIGMGTTVRRIMATIQKESPTSRCIGILLYTDKRWSGGWKEVDKVPTFQK